MRCMNKINGMLLIKSMKRIQYKAMMQYYLSRKRSPAEKRFKLNVKVIEEKFLNS